MLAKALLDTDTLSAVMKKQPIALERAKEYLTVHRCFTFSLITRYEILRGLKAKHAVTQLRSFEHLCQASHIIPLTDEIVIRAADIYADLKRRGQLISDADILIAASALVNDMQLITNNESHFERITALRIGNWLKG